MVRLPETHMARKFLAAFWFAGFALLASGVFFFHGPMAFRAIVLYILLPSFAGGIAGYFWGGVILDSSAVKTYAGSMLRGVVVTLAAYVIFAVLFTVAIAVSESLSAPSLFVWTITLGFLMVGPFILTAGIVAAVSLRRFGIYAFRKHAITSN